MKPVMRGMAIVAALLLASVAGVTAQDVTADDCSVREWLPPLQQPLQDYGAVLTGLETGIADIDDPEDPLALVGVMQTLQRANQAFIDEAAGIVEDCDLQVAVDDYLGSPVEPNPQVADIMLNLQLDQESGIAESCWRTPAGEALSAFYSRGLANVAVAEAMAKEADAGNFDTPPDYLVVTYGAALAYNRALDDIDFDCAAAGADSDGGQEVAAATRAQGDALALDTAPLCGAVQDRADRLLSDYLSWWVDEMLLHDRPDAIALTNILTELEDILWDCQHGSLDTEPTLWFHVWEDDRWQDLRISVAASIDIEEPDNLMARMRAGTGASDLLLPDAVVGGNLPVELRLLSYQRDTRKDDIDIIRPVIWGPFGQRRYFRCELSEQQDEVDIYACTER